MSLVVISTTSMVWWIITKIQKMGWGGKRAHGPEVTHDCVRCGERKLDSWCHIWQEEWVCCTCTKHEVVLMEAGEEEEGACSPAFCPSCGLV